MNKTEIIAQYATSQNDTGSTEVQCAILTHKINDLTVHLKKNRKDFQTRRGLIGMVIQRKKLLKNLKKNNNKKYDELLKLLNLSKN
jgi:small subunit ribosomal protein S15